MTLYYEHNPHFIYKNLVGNKYFAFLSKLFYAQSLIGLQIAKINRSILWIRLVNGAEVSCLIVLYRFL